MLPIHAARQGGEIALVLEQLLVRSLKVGDGSPGMHVERCEINLRGRHKLLISCQFHQLKETFANSGGKLQIRLDSGDTGAGTQVGPHQLIEHLGCVASCQERCGQSSLRVAPSHRTSDII